MNISKYIVLGILAGLFNMYPISYKLQFYICTELFNTNIFYDTNYISLLNIGMIISICLIYRNDIMNFGCYILKDFKKKKELKKKKKGIYKSKNIKYIKCLFITCSINIIFYFIFRFKEYNVRYLGYLYLFTVIFLLFTYSKKGSKRYDDITYVDAIIIGLSSILSIVPSISILLCNLFACTKQGITKKTSLRYSLTCIIPTLLLDSTKGIIYITNNQAYILEMIIGIIISVFVTCGIYKSLKYMYYTNKLYRLALFCLLLSLFYMYWFR